MYHKNPPSLLTMLKSAGRFFYIRMEEYSKEYSTPHQLIEILKSRGLKINNSDEQTLRSIGYYRLSAYLHPYLATPKSKHQFKPDSTFTKSIQLYNFDRKLRLLVFDQIERIEIAVRSAIVNITCQQTCNPFWMTDPSYYARSDKFQRTMSLIDKELQTSREDFIEHFIHTYSNSYPPAWMLSEIIPFGVLTRVYENIASNQIRKKIAQYFGLSVPVMASWLTIITLTRNSCCHHSRLWNKTLSLKALLMNRWSYPWISDSVQQGRIFFTLCIIKHFLDIVYPQNTLKEDIHKLLEEFPIIDIEAMGFPQKWEKEALWENK